MATDQSSAKGSGEVAGDKLLPLLERRSELKQRLDLLDSKRQEVSTDVFAKVQADYTSRLASLNQEIDRHVRNLQSTRKDYQELLDRLKQAVELGQRSLEELKIRHALGEYSADEFAEIGREKKSRVEHYRKKLDKYGQNLERLESMLVQITGS